MFAKRFDPNSVVKKNESKKIDLLKKIKKSKNLKETKSEETKDEPEEEKKKGVDEVRDPKSESEAESESTSDSEDNSDSEVDSDSENESDDDTNLEELNLLKRKRDSENNSDHESDIESDNEYKNSHSMILSRFKQTMSLQPQLESAGMTVNPNDNLIEEDNIPKQDVEPLPQPKLPKDKRLQSHSDKNKSLDWLTTPNFYDTKLTKPFTDLNPKINEILVKNLKSQFEIKSAFSVQVTLIESLVKDLERQKLDPTPRGDYLVNAATGSGKTLAYLIPIIQSIIGRRVHLGIKCIILLPTKPLVTQVYSDSLKLSKGIDINIVALKGDLSINEEREKLCGSNDENIPDIVISTPGRLVEHLNSLNLHNLRWLIVDEADRLLNQSFQGWCDLLINKIDNDNKNDESKGSKLGFSLISKFKLKCIKVILSATLTTNSEKLSHLKLFKPKLVVVNDSESLVNELYQLPPTLDEFFIKIPESLAFFKPLILLKFFEINKGFSSHGIIFTKSNESAIRLGRLLNLIYAKENDSDKSLIINCINSTMNNQDRLKILKNFDQNGGLLICTDLLSRGLNFNSIKFVINYDLPLSTKEYIHRVGRTSRAGNEGKSVTFCFGDGDFKWFKNLVYSGGIINRNKKEINEIKFMKEEQKTGQGFEFPVDLTEEDKGIYESCLKELQHEVYNK